MIGQTALKAQVAALIKKGIFPSTAIFIGPEGSGRKTFIKEHFKCIEASAGSASADAVRESIKLAYTQHDTVFMFADVDELSTAAVNALLKVIEECPNGNSFILTAKSTTNTLSTIISRCSVFYMSPYSAEEIVDFAMHYTTARLEDGAVIRDICATPGEVLTLLMSGDVRDFEQYVKLVANNIATVSGANAFKIASRIAFKDTDNGYDLSLFWKCFVRLCAQSMSESKEKTELYSQMIVDTNTYASMLAYKSVNKSMLMDLWILQIRSDIFDYAERNDGYLEPAVGN